MKPIVSIFDPSIELTQLSIVDTEYGTDPNYKPNGKEFKHSKYVGDYSPFIEINGMRFHADTMEFFELDLTGFMPKVTIAIRERGGLFSSKSFPRDGDQMLVYIKSSNSDFKPIRADFRILDVDSAPSTDESGESNVYVIEGILDLPTMYSDKLKSYSKKTSSETLQEIAKELQLGFAANELTMNDAMTRICPFIPYEDFIRNDILPSSYRDDNSFFTMFIDQHYYANMVEVNQLFTHDKELDQATVHMLSQSDYRPDDMEVRKELFDVFLSNSRYTYNTPHQITGYTPLNSSGHISLRNGYRTYLQQYDKKEKSYSQYFMETLNTDGSNEKIILKGRASEDHTKQIKTANMGMMFGDNVHKNYNHARLQNKINTDEIKKLNLLVDLAAVSPGLHRYQTIPIYIMNNGGNDIRENATRQTGDAGYAMDQFLSGFYVITGMKLIYEWSTKRFHQQLVCAKREYDYPL